MSNTLLIVEDNEMNRDLLSRRLQKKGFKVVLAIDGVDAMHRLREAEADVDLVLMDMNLPVQDGWTTCQMIKDDPLLNHLPIIALTAHAMTNDRERARAVGCTEYETKPINFQQLLGKIQKLLACQTATNC
ncbi:MAG: response regulator [Pseudomonadales bacterium]